MKKYILSIFALGLASFCMSAQNDTTSTAAKDRLAEIENMSVEIKKHKSAKSKNDVFEINALSHIGYGRHKVDGDAFRSKFGQSYELFVNVFDLSINPVSWLSFNAGADLKWDRYISKSTMFTVGDDGAFSSVAGGVSNLKSRICTFGIGIPATVSLHFGSTSLRLGAEGTFNLSRYNKAKSAYTIDDTDFTRLTKGGKVENFRYAYLAVIDFDGLGIYYKYCPKSLIPGSNMIEKYQTIGIVLSM